MRDVDNWSLSKENLQECIENLPEYIKEIIGKARVPADNGRKILEALIKGTAVGSSDGLLVESTQEGGYAYSLQSYESDAGRVWG